jgi:hypothetical protein
VLRIDARGVCREPAFFFCSLCGGGAQWTLLTGSYQKFAVARCWKRSLSKSGWARATVWIAAPVRVRSSHP